MHTEIVYVGVCVGVCVGSAPTSALSACVCAVHVSERYGILGSNSSTSKRDTTHQRRSETQLINVGRETQLINIGRETQLINVGRETQLKE
jgi:hypothetical protein